MPDPNERDQIGPGGGSSELAEALELFRDPEFPVKFPLKSESDLAIPRPDPKEALRARLRNDYTFHPPRDQTDIDKHEAVRNAGRDFAMLLVTLLPLSRELSKALSCIEDATMNANAALAALARNR